MSRTTCADFEGNQKSGYSRQSLAHRPKAHHTKVIWAAASGAKRELGDEIIPTLFVTASQLSA